MLNKSLHMLDDVVLQHFDGRLRESLTDNTSLTRMGYFVDSTLCVVGSGRSLKSTVRCRFLHICFTTVDAFMKNISLGNERYDRIRFANL